MSPQQEVYPKTGTGGMKKPKRSLGYIIYFICITVGLLYCLFPSDAVVDYLQVKAQNLRPSLSISIDRIKPWPLLKLRFTNVQVLQRDQPERKLFMAETLVVRPQVGSFLKGTQDWSFRCAAYGGAIKGKASLNGSAANSLNAEVELEAIRIGEYKDLKDLIGRSVDGVLSGTVSYAGPGQEVLNGTGEANFRLVDGRIELLSPLLNLESIEYSEITIAMVLKGKRVNLTRVDLEGPMLKGTVSGIIRLEEELEKSNLDLKGRIEPFPGLFEQAEGAQSVVKFFRGRLKRGVLPFRIRGTIAHPRITFI
jgi:type II secretion system protein N